MQWDMVSGEEMDCWLLSYRDVRLLTTEDALAVDRDSDGVAVHVRHADAQNLTVIVQVPDTNVFIAARSKQLRTVASQHTLTRYLLAYVHLVNYILIVKLRSDNFY